MGKREELIEKIMAQYEAGNEPAIMGVDEFFDGNADEYSIAPNTVGAGHPGLRYFWDRLKAIGDQAGVEHVFIGILECPDADDEDDADLWPSAENVYIYTSASKEDVAKWAAGLNIDSVFEGWPYGCPAGAPKTRDGFKVYTLCWD